MTFVLVRRFDHLAAAAHDELSLPSPKSTPGTDRMEYVTILADSNAGPVGTRDAATAPGMRKLLRRSETLACGTVKKFFEEGERRVLAGYQLIVIWLFDETVEVAVGDLERELFWSVELVDNHRDGF